jgi:hypothetical protein
MRRSITVGLALVAVAAALAPMLAIGFVNDDYTIIRFALHGDSPDFAALLSRAEVIEVYYRPLFDLSLGLDFLAWGWTPIGYHITSLALHLVNTFLVYRLARGLRFDRTASIAALLIFGLHPIHETSLHWIAGRTDVLCATFYLGSLLLFIRHRMMPSIDTLVGALVCAMLAMLTKEMALTLPLVAALVSWWLHRDYAPRPGRVLLDGVRSALPFAVVIGGVLLARVALLDNDLFGSTGVHADVPALQLVRNLATYAGLLVVPAGHEQIEEVLRSNPWLFLAIAIISLGVAAYVLVRWRSRLAPLLFCVVALGVTLVPVLRLMMRWYLYVPSVFFAIGAGWLLARLAERRRAMALGILGALSILYAAIDLASIDAWVRASRVAGSVGADLRSTSVPVEPGDTLRFVTIPGKLGSAPIFNLGFAGTVQHLLGADVEVEVASKVVLPDYPTVMATHISAHADTAYIDAPAGGSFAINSAAVVGQQRAPDMGSVIETEAGAVLVTRASRARRPISIAVAMPEPASPGGRRSLRFFTFDGRRLVELSPDR